MTNNQDTCQTEFYYPILMGNIVVFLSIIILAAFFGVFTHLGWRALLSWPSGVYLILVYISLTMGSIYAGLGCRNQGWAVGAGVGLLASLLLLVATFLAGEPIKWWVSIFKAFVNIFICVFGGIIGINLAKK
jgi:putative membrane protein (TIGR04086 family)